MTSRPSVVKINGHLRTPTHTAVGRRVDTLLKRGRRQLVLDLAGLSDIDAAGLGELVEFFNKTAAVGGVVQLVHAHGHVRTLLEVTGVLRLLAPTSQGLCLDVPAEREAG